MIIVSIGPSGSIVGNVVFIPDDQYYVIDILWLHENIFNILPSGTREYIRYSSVIIVYLFYTIDLQPIV